FAGCSDEQSETVAESSEGGTYQERLNATAKQFAYFQLWSENLKGVRWESQGVSLRVPKPFEWVPSPAPTNLSQAHVPSQEVLGEPLPGVLGMWKAKLPGADSATSESAYLFVMSNQHFPPARRRDALAFQQTLIEDVLARLPGLNNKLPIDSEWKSTGVLGHGLPYTMGTFRATLAETKKPADFTLYLMQNGDNDRHDEIKVAMLFVVPLDVQLKGSRPDVDPQKLSAETLRIALPPGEDS
ncbi:MAG: hypothetical protein KDA84_15945, partial [Planctomycetaceae bacterium]|nr:hypothetical protein [Planctomycetaceae bacterium]